MASSNPPSAGSGSGSRSSGAGAARFWARAEVRSRGVALVVLGLLAAFAGGVALAAVAGARRESTVFDRYRVATGAPDAIVFGTQTGQVGSDYRGIERLKDVTASGQFALAPIGLETPSRAKACAEIGTLAPADPGLYRTVARPLLKSGRLPDPARDDEVVVNRAAAAACGLRVGSKVSIISANSILAFWGQAPMRGGPTVAATVVGVGDSEMDLLFGGPDAPSFTPSSGFLAQHGVLLHSEDEMMTPNAAGKVPYDTNLVVRLRPGADRDAFVVASARVLHLDIANPARVPVRNVVADNKRVQHSTELEGTGLLVFAAAVALAGLLFVGQAIARMVYAMGESARTLAALGLTRSDLAIGLTLPLVLTAGIGGVGSVGVATLLSQQFPLGLGAIFEPDPGIHFDTAVLLPGALIVALAVLAIAVLAAIRVGRARVRRRAESPIVGWLRRTLPLPMGIGAGLALDRGRGKDSLPARPAIVAAIAGVVGVVGCFGLVAGIDDAIAHPQRAGQTWSADFSPDSAEQYPTIVSTLEKDRDVHAVASVYRIPLVVDGVGLPVYSLDREKGTISFALLEGHAPRSDHEAVIGPESSAALNRGIGDTVRVGEKAAPLKIVGVGLLPQTPHSSFDQGLWTTTRALETAAGSAAAGGEAGLATAIVRYRSGVNADAKTEQLMKKLPVEGETAAQPQDVVLLTSVRSLPRTLAFVLAFLALAALGHALVTAVRRRRRDLAVLRSLGFTRRQSGACVVFQATTVGIIALVIGIPLGIYVGVAAWNWVASSTPLVFIPPVALPTVAIVVPATLVAAVALAAWPARRAGRIRPAAVFRTE